MKQLLLDATLCSFAEKSADITLIDQEKIKKLCSRTFADDVYWPKITNSFTIYHPQSMDNSYALRGPRVPNLRAINHLDKLAKSILNIGEGKIILAGLSVASAIYRSHSKNYDFYFCDCDLEHAKRLFEKCVQHMNNMQKLSTYEHTQYSMTLCHRKYKFRFIKYIYKNYQQILANIGHAGARIGYDGNKIFATIEGATAIATGAFILNLSKVSSTFVRDMEDFINRNIYSAYLPTFNNIDELVKIANLPINDYITEVVAHFEKCISNNQNHINSGRSQEIIFETHIEDVIQPSESSMFSAVTDHSPFYDFSRDDNVLQQFFGHKYEKLRQHDRKYIEKIIFETAHDYLRIADEVAKLVNKWTIWPPLTDQTKSEIYVPLIIGLANERVIMFRLCILTYKLPVELENLLITAWFSAEVNDARVRIFALME